jgi:tetratricopeptide (TPR) repeat protein
MNDTLRALNQSELLALALEASRRSDSGHAMAYLKEAATRADASAQALFLLGSEYAQVGLFAEAAEHMSRALVVSPDLAIARFQLGMLHLTSGQPELAQAVWAPLATLQDGHPQAAYLKPFHRGMEHLIADRFDEALAALSAGVEANLENPALNGDMRKVIDAIQHLPGSAAAAAPTTFPPVAGASGAGETQALAQAPGLEEDSLEPSHLFINAYTHSGKPH